MAIKTNLIHDVNVCLCDFVLQLEHCRRDIARINNILLFTKGRFNDSGMKGIGYQRDDKVPFCNLSIQCFGICHIEGNRTAILEA